MGGGEGGSGGWLWVPKYGRASTTVWRAGVMSCYEKSFAPQLSSHVGPCGRGKGGIAGQRGVGGERGVKKKGYQRAFVECGKKETTGEWREYRWRERGGAAGLTLLLHG